MQNGRLTLMDNKEVEALADWLAENRRQIGFDSSQGNQEARKLTVMASWLVKFMMLPTFDKEDCSHVATLLKEQVEIYKATEWLPLPEQDEESPAALFARMLLESIMEEIDNDLE